MVFMINFLILNRTTFLRGLVAQILTKWCSTDSNLVNLAMDGCQSLNQSIKSHLLYQQTKHITMSSFKHTRLSRRGFKIIARIRFSSIMEQCLWERFKKLTTHKQKEYT